MQKRDIKGRFVKGMIPWNKGKKKWIIPYNKGQHKIKPLYQTYYCTICGNPLSERQVANLLSRNRWNGQHPKEWGCSKECGQKISAKARIGRPCSTETRKKIGEKQIGEKNHAYGKPSWNKGIPMRPESRAKLKANAHVMYGKDHPNWQGGISYEPYGKGWKSKVRYEIRDRDKHQCQLCGKPENGRGHDVHHIDYDKKNLDPNNLITLCNSCHMKTGFHRAYWRAFFEGQRESPSLLETTG